jgi:hypothetical protein
MNLLMICYHYMDLIINIGSLDHILENYYAVNNSRGLLTLNIDVKNMSVPFNHGQPANPQQVLDAIAYVNANKPLVNSAGVKYDVFVHLCNPPVSHTGYPNAISYASVTNTVHEFGHLLGLTHAYSDVTGTIEYKDLFDEMTTNSPYPSMNPVHRWQKGWFLEGEYVEMLGTGPNTYTLYMLSNFADTTNVKTIHYQYNNLNTFICYGSRNQVAYYVAVYIFNGNNSIIQSLFEVEVASAIGNTFNSPSTNTTITLNTYDPTFVNITVTCPGNQQLIGEVVTNPDFIPQPPTDTQQQVALCGDAQLATPPLTPTGASTVTPPLTPVGSTQ